MEVCVYYSPGKVQGKHKRNFPIVAAAALMNYDPDNVL